MIIAFAFFALSLGAFLGLVCTIMHYRTMMKMKKLGWELLELGVENVDFVDSEEELRALAYRLIYCIYI